MSLKELMKLMKEVKALTPDEQRQLQDFLDKLLEDAASRPLHHSHPSHSIESKLERKLLEAGLLSEIKPLVVESKSYRNYKPVKVRGKPVSETIIEERR